MVALKERREDWIPVLVTLKKCFNQYPIITNCCDTLEGTKIKGTNSSSFEGNFLESINLTMNGKHYINETGFCFNGKKNIIERGKKKRCQILFLQSTFFFT